MTGSVSLFKRHSTWQDSGYRAGKPTRTTGEGDESVLFLSITTSTAIEKVYSSFTEANISRDAIGILSFSVPLDVSPVWICWCIYELTISVLVTASLSSFQITGVEVKPTTSSCRPREKWWMYCKPSVRHQLITLRHRWSSALVIQNDSKNSHVAAAVHSAVTKTPMNDQLVCQHDVISSHHQQPGVASALHKYCLPFSSFLLHFHLTPLYLWNSHPPNI